MMNFQKNILNKNGLQIAAFLYEIEVKKFFSFTRGKIYGIL